MFGSPRTFDFRDFFRDRLFLRQDDGLEYPVFQFSHEEHASDTTYLGVPCLTLRENTERPITVWEGTNVLIGRDFDLLKQEIEKVVSGNPKVGKIPEKWEGK